ncbi:peptidyl-prolyl cis-trans isomerase [Aliikangiella coralliicola]|uniref:Peptidyl-prolyl cis-trans isomerase n=2 Tax=Aliikangiella coralliicola TaxID=2592383 RepID=A0A545UI09_9GAMM|nr:peptidyl-prolyl cis-trans isomerase [Aliikangiella coralliicola]
MIGTFVSQAQEAPANKKQNGADVQPDNLFPRVLLETAVGKVLIELDRDRAPITVNNFLAYVVAGSYDGTVFHRVVRDFVVQGGGYDILYNPRDQREPIFNESGNGLKNEMYSIAMARESDPHSATNQFYFNMADNESLNPGKDWGYTVFGMVMEGGEVLDLIARAQTHTNPELGWDEVPIKQIVLKKATLLKEE